MSDDVEDREAKLLEQALGAAKQEHEELSDQFNALDSKAQGAMTIAGIFVAGMLGFINSLTDTAPFGQRVLLTAATALLALCVTAALLVVAVREVTAPPGGGLLQLVEDLLRSNNAAEPDRLRNFARDHIRMWAAANKSIRDVNASKAKRLIFAQWLLLAAVVCAGLVTLMKTWGVHNGSMR
jgi:hypothetical protein